FENNVGAEQKGAFSVAGALASPSTAYIYDWNLLPIGQMLWEKELMSYIDYPPLQMAASYNLEQVLATVREMGKSHPGQCRVDDLGSRAALSRIAEDRRAVSAARGDGPSSSVRLLHAAAAPLRPRAPICFACPPLRRLPDDRTTVPKPLESRLCSITQ